MQTGVSKSVPDLELPETYLEWNLDYQGTLRSSYKEEEEEF